MTTITAWHIAQINIGTTLHPLDDPRIAGFVAQLDAVNALADASPGFVWRLQSASGNATDIKVSDDPNFIVNMSVWATIEALFDFVYKTAHRPVMVQRRQWFVPPTGAYMALWWVPAGTVPTVAEGLARIAELDANGPSPRAFTFKAKFPPPDAAGAGEGGGAPEDMRPDPFCVGWR
jgi:hypothetical protein